MISIPSYTIGESRPVELTIDKHSNMVLIGTGATSYGLNSVVYANDYNEVLKNYGECELSEAFKLAQDFECEFIFLMNVMKPMDIIDNIEVLRQNDFTYAVPLCFKLSDTYRNEKDVTKEVYFIERILAEIGNLNETIFIVTEKHASLFEDQRAFVDYMDETTSNFLAGLHSFVRKNNVICVANNLKAHDLANVAVAASLCTTDMSKYPEGNFGEAYFLIDELDTHGDWAYFQNHVVKETTIENLLNFQLSGMDKIVTEDRIIRMIKRELSFDTFKGKLYREYIRLKIFEYINS